MDDNTDSQSLLQSVLGIFTRKRPQRSAKPVSLESRKREAWLRTDAFLQRDNLDEADPESVTRTLRALEHYVQDDCDREINFSFHQPGLELYPTLRRMVKNPSSDSHTNPDIAFHPKKRRRECDDAIQELLNLEQERKKRRVLPREETSHGSSLEDPDADFAVLMRRHLVTLDNALRRHWVCVCQKCSGLTVRLSLPQHTKDLEAEASFEVFFGVRSVPATALQEAKITVKDLRSSILRRSSEPIISRPPDFAHICQSITESLGQRNCLHFALEDGSFQRLRPQPKTFSSDRISRTVSLSALFNRQQELLHGKSVLPLKGKRVLAVTLASALLPFLETPWLQFSFNHSKIQFFEPRQDGELPDITKPFLALEHVPTISARSNDIAAGSDSSKHIVHPNASVLALGILLCELHYCTPVELMAKNPHAARNVNDDFYTCIDKLQTLEDDAGVDYYLATKACLTGEYYPTGQRADFEDVSVQRLFYQNVVKRLESVIFKAWGIRLENLGSFDARQNQSCWGPVGREVVRLHKNQLDPSNAEKTTRASPHRSMSDTVPVRSYPPLHSDVMLSIKPSSQSQNQERLAKHSKTKLNFFDASQQTGSEEENPLSERWMDNLLSSIYPFVDLDLDLVEPVRIAILDSGLDPENPFLIEDQQLPNPRVKEARSFIHGTEPHDVRDEIGHGTHALGLLLKVAPCAEIYVARIARRETLDPNTYDDIAKAINHAVEQWRVDIISMSFGIREHHELMTLAISNALNSRTLLFAAASNDGANLARAFPAQCPSVFCIHSTDGNGNPSAFNPTASETDVNFSLLGESVSSHWPAGLNGHRQSVNVMSGTSVATPIAAGLAASVLSFVRQQDQQIAVEGESLGPWLKRDNSMDAVFKSMVRQRRGAGYDYITPHVLFDSGSTKENVYGRIKDIKRNMYRY